MQEHSQHNCLSGFYSLICASRIASSDGQPGLSWLELFLLAAANTTGFFVLTHGYSAASSKSIAVHVKEFISAVKRFVGFALATHFHPLFDAPTSSSNRLLTYGFLTRLPHTSLFLDLNPEVQHLLDIAMLQLHTSMSADQKAALSRGTLQLKVRKFSGHLSLRCHERLNELTEALRQSTSASNCEVRHPRPPSPTVFACTHCGKTRRASPPFHVHEATKAIWCRVCRVGVHGSGWICLCGKVWHHCSKHFSSPLASLDDAPPPRTHQAGSSQSDVSRGSGTNRAEAQLEKLEPHKVSKLCLGPKLANKFPRLVNKQL
eukprot:1437580-Karenia_brevis.AAC.1